MPEHRVVYWDTCLYIAWLLDEPHRKPGEMEGIEESALHIEKRRQVLLGSRVLEVEFLNDVAESDPRNLFDRWINSRLLQLIDYSPPIQSLAREIRAYYRARGERVPSVADAYHLATAIIWKADALYTFDQGGRDGVNLLALDGNVAGRPLHICKAPFTQLSLRLKT